MLSGKLSVLLSLLQLQLGSCVQRFVACCACLGCFGVSDGPIRSVVVDVSFVAQELGSEGTCSLVVNQLFNK